MRKIELKSRKLLRKVFNGISLTAVAFIFQACYGPWHDEYCDVRFTGTVTSKTTNLPIKGIKIAIDKGVLYGFTDENGKFDIYASVPNGYNCEDCTPGKVNVHFLDVDGANNGYFADKTMEINHECKDEVVINIELEKIE